MKMFCSTAIFKDIRVASAAVAVTGLIYFAFILLAALKDSFICITVSGLALICLITLLIKTLIEGFLSWRKVTIWWSIPCLMAFVSLYYISWIAQSTRDLIIDNDFKKNLIGYYKIVDDCKAGLIPLSSQPHTVDIQLPNVLPDGVIALRGARLDNGEVIVEFFRSNSGRIHRGYVYEGTASFNGIYPSIIEFGRCIYLRHVQENWYHFSDGM